MDRRQGSYRVDYVPEMERRLAELFVYLVEEDLAAGDDSLRLASAVREASDLIESLLKHAPDSVGRPVRGDFSEVADAPGFVAPHQLDIYPLSVRYVIHRTERLVLIIDLIWTPGMTAGE